MMPLGSSSLAVAMDVNEKHCDVANFSFNVESSERASIKSYGSDVVTFGVRLTDMRIIKPELAQGSQMIVRIWPIDFVLPRRDVRIEERQPDSLVNGRREYKTADSTTYQFYGVDGQSVEVTGGLTTWEGARIFAENIRIRYQFDKSRKDFETLDGRLIELLKQIELKLETK